MMTSRMFDASASKYHDPVNARRTSLGAARYTGTH
jgi:hypothetical protein